MNVMGIIFANDGTLDALTAHRTMASLPFGGRYRQVDFALSNLACVGVHHIGVITRHHYQSLINHIGSGEEWGLGLQEGGLEFLTPYAMSSTNNYRGKLESLHSAMGFLKKGPEDEYAVLIDATVLCNIDLNKVLTSHIESGRDLTIVAKKGIANGKKPLDLALKLDENGEISDMAVDYEAPADYLASMDIFVLSKKWLIAQITEHIARNRYHMDRDLVLGLWQTGQVSVNVYSFEGVALFNETVEEYFANSQALLHSKIRWDLFRGNHPVYTKVRGRVPSYYGDNSRISNCLVADGCMLEGTAKDSIFFRQVVLSQGAQVENCVIMNDTVIGKNCYLKYVILDKDVSLRPGATLVGTPTNPVIIKRGEVL